MVHTWGGHKGHHRVTNHCPASNLSDPTVVRKILGRIGSHPQDIQSMGLRQTCRKAMMKYMALPLHKRILYAFVFVTWHLVLLTVAILSNRLQRNLAPLAHRMLQTPGAWFILSALIVLVSIPPLFGHELLAVVAGYVYGDRYGFLLLMISSIVGESIVYFAFRFWLKNYISSFRRKYDKNYGVFVGVVEDGGIVMLWLIRMSVIPPHFSTPLFSSLENITWYKWMIANVLASPVKFFPPVFLGTLLMNKHNNSVVGDMAFGLSTVITFVVLWYIRKTFVQKKQELRDRAALAELEMPVIPSPGEAVVLEKDGQAEVVVMTMADYRPPCDTLLRSFTQPTAEQMMTGAAAPTTTESVLAEKSLDGERNAQFETPRRFDVVRRVMGDPAVVSVAKE